MATDIIKKAELDAENIKKTTQYNLKQSQIDLQKELEELSDKQDTLEFVMGISLRTESGKHKYVDNILEKF